jgi:hypothetical protein
MKANTLKPRSGWHPERVMGGPRLFNRADEHYWPFDRDTHERKVSALTIRKESATSSALESAIQASRQMLKLEEDWDDAGAQPIAEGTWTGAMAFLRRTVSRSGVSDEVVVPTISACRDGSIDFFWKTSLFRFLVNIKPALAESDYYAETVGAPEDRFVVKGKFGPDRHDLSVVLKLLLANSNV